MRNRATTPLSKAKIRQSWSKYNLYNLQRFRTPPTFFKTHFQQKWAAKSVSRAYHGEQVRESQWTRMFSKRLRAVMPMNPIQLARDDGSQMSAGRGSGLDPDGSERKSDSKRIPYTHMTFAPLERRLDVAIFRAMFASSTRQARQFVIHGAVTVNGQRMTYPGYLLNPGDLFQVEPEQVMYATGAPKDRMERREGRTARKQAAEARRAAAEAAEDVEEGAPAEEAAEEKDGEPAAEAEAKGEEDPRQTLRALLAQAKKIMTSSKEVLPAKRKQELRAFQRSVRRVLSRSQSSAVLTDNLEAQLSEITSLLKATRGEKTTPKEEQVSKKSEPEDVEPSSSTAAADNKTSEQLAKAFQKASLNPEAELDEETTAELSDEDLNVLKRALVQLRDNPIDSTKPYATPWRPRDYMSAFALIPRYLEVNHNICAAVYLRHPVARPGLAEVPTPFGENISTSAFAWYLRRR
ncbi:hypothetical protein ASPZODRAFT_72861 [Penicilliopsis zonata CBS 506.65]|uniref:Small ribosomal subunit protein uS4m n=1 Tax=Penicilliopsis zonata CBS 506.65 TaxID=1073090 RepID=A0A1L9SAB6_9EURO|nr:hypothetical protein ASPZODRAFT_72861 [Penicilliopsis zonata CBS 506.65]OJJ44135.1 hypothetical protein ASPZODRAFT_72861 [Penicilliopsis zonata CBS 506.65]